MKRIYQINQRLNKRHPNSNQPFQIMTRLLEECGELAQQVNHFENMGIKQQKHGQPNKAHLAKEIQDILRCALQLATHYQIEAELETSINQSYSKMQEAKLIA